MTTPNDLIQWAHELGAEAMLEARQAGLSMDEICVVMSMAHRFVLQAHPNPKKRFLLIQEADAIVDVFERPRRAQRPWALFERQSVACTSKRP